MSLRAVPYRERKQQKYQKDVGSPKVKSPLRSILSLIFYFSKRSIKFHTTSLQSRNENMAPGNIEQDFVRFSKQSLIKRKTMKRDTYSVWERGCQEISKHFLLLKNGILDGFSMCVCVCVYWPWGTGAPLCIRSQCKGVGDTEQIGLITTNTARLSVLLRATLNWLQCFFTS